MGTFMNLGEFGGTSNGNLRELWGTHLVENYNQAETLILFTNLK
jgi:hypothetical protein